MSHSFFKDKNKDTKSHADICKSLQKISERKKKTLWIIIIIHKTEFSHF